MITKRQFIRAAKIVTAINEGQWTGELPDWGQYALSQLSATKRGIQTAEAFILLFREDNPRFDQQRFLYACGLGPKPAAKRRTV